MMRAGANDMKPIYLDYNATTPIDPRVAEAMLPHIRERFGNPSSAHAFGAEAKKAVERARAQVAALLGCDPGEVVFTSGGTESNNHALKGAADARDRKGNHIVTTAIEHPAVTEVCRYLERRGFGVTYVPVDGDGLVDPRAIEDAITPRTILISVMHANNEVGTIEPVAEIAEIARRRGILLHSDCAQSAGKIPVRVDELGADLVSIAGHKLYAPKGVGALYVRTGVELERFIHGASQESGRRAGTENVIEIVGLGEACAIALERMTRQGELMKRTRDRLEKGIVEAFPWVRVNGHAEKRLPNTASVGFRGLEANTILSELAPAVAASAGAACHADGIELSSVLEAMNVPEELAMGTIRFSTGRFTTQSEIDEALDEIVSVVRRLAPAESPERVELTPGEVKLTRFTHGLGCACKLRAQLLEQVLKKIPPPKDARILVGTETSDDAAVYRIDERTAIVQTVDFFTPIVDDPFEFGAISAANSLSDVYAMGARPLFALSVVGFPSARLPIEVLGRILAGARSKTDEAGIAIVGGHTVDDTEPKFGLVVTGIVDPEKVVTNRGARPGDALVLTKPIGTGILSTALKRGIIGDEARRFLSDTMAALNRAASEAMQETGVSACTDVTGFGLLGHLLEMMIGSDAAAVVSSSKVPLLAGALQAAVAGAVPGGTRNNFSHTEPSVEYDPGVSETMKLLLNDAQTSGGLLISVEAGKMETLAARLDAACVSHAVVGEVVSARAKRIRVMR
jgi:cysteine desulfurase NifS/selenium donor protein